MKKCFYKLKSQHSNACLFWNGLVYLAYIIGMIINYEVTFDITCFMSVFILIVWFWDADELWDDKKGSTNNIWLWLMPIVWFVMLICLTIYSLIKFEEVALKRFNTWLNSKRSN